MQAPIRPPASGSARWPTLPLGEAVEQSFLGMVLHRHKPVREVLHVPVITLRDLEEEQITGPPEAMAIEPPASWERYRILAGDVLLTCRGGVHRVVLAPAWIEGVLASSALIVLRPGARLRGAVLAAFLRSGPGQAELQKRLRISTTTQSLNLKDVVTVPVPVPAEAIQREIERWFEVSEEAYRSGMAEARCRRDLGRGIIVHLLAGVDL